MEFPETFVAVISGAKLPEETPIVGAVVLQDMISTTIAMPIINPCVFIKGFPLNLTIYQRVLSSIG